MRVRGIATAAHARALRRACGAPHPRPDAVLLTGDLVHDDAGRLRGAARARSRDAGAPVHCLPGNHDDPADVRRDLDGPPFVHDFASRHGAWMFVMLDSTIAGENGGHLDDRAARAARRARSPRSRTRTRSSACTTTRCRTAAPGSTS